MVKYKGVKLFNFPGNGGIAEDVVGFSAKALWVYDVSPIGKNLGLSGSNLSDSNYIASCWNTFTMTNIDKYKDFKKFLYDATTYINKEVCRGITEEDKKMLPVVSFSIVRVVEDYLDINIIGSSEVIIKNKDGSITVYKDEVYNEVTFNFINEMQKESELKGCAVVETRKYLDHTRKQLIKDGFVSVYRHKESDIAFVKNYKIPLEDVEYVLLYSDGVARYYNTFKLGGEWDLYEIVRSNDYLKVYDDLKWVQTNDKLCERYPRIKPYADMSLIAAEI